MLPAAGRLGWGGLGQQAGNGRLIKGDAVLDGQLGSDGE